HEDERQNEREREVITGASELLRTARETGRITRRDAYLFRKLVHLLDHCGLRTTGTHVSEERHLSLPVQTVDRRRSGSFFNLHQVVEGDPTDFRRRDDHALQAFDARAKLSDRTHADVILIG